MTRTRTRIRTPRSFTCRRLLRARRLNTARRVFSAGCSASQIVDRINELIDCLIATASTDTVSLNKQLTTRTSTRMSAQMATQMAARLVTAREVIDDVHDALVTRGFAEGQRFDTTSSTQTKIWTTALYAIVGLFVLNVLHVPPGILTLGVLVAIPAVLLLLEGGGRLLYVTWRNILVARYNTTKRLGPPEPTADAALLAVQELATAVLRFHRSDILRAARKPAALNDTLTTCHTHIQNAARILEHITEQESAFPSDRR